MHPPQGLGNHFKATEKLHFGTSLTVNRCQKAGKHASKTGTPLAIVLHQKVREKEAPLIRRSSSRKLEALHPKGIETANERRRLLS
jgi:hypothetical protein